MLKNKIISILIFGFLALTGLLAQPYYQVLADYTGQNRNVSVIESAASKLAEALPQEFRSSFKVLEYDAYVYEENMHGEMEQAWATAQAKADANATYYVLYVYISNNKKFNFDVKTYVKLPDTENFKCTDSEFSTLIRGITEGEARRELLSPNVDLGIQTGLIKAAEKTTKQVSCCNSNKKCVSLNAQEMIDALVAAGYYQLSPSEIHVFNNAPGGGVVGTVDIKLDFEDHGLDLSAMFSSFLQNGGSYARLRKFDSTNDTLFKVDEPTSGNWKDAVVIKKDGQEVILINISIDPSGTNFSGTPQALIYAVRLVYEIGSEVFFDCLIQLVFEKFASGSSWADSWNNLKLDGSSLKEAFKNGSLNFVASLFGSATASAKNKAIINGINGAVQYLLSFNDFTGGINNFTESNSSVSSFSLAQLVQAFVTGAAGDLFQAVSKHSAKIIPKLKARLNNSGGRDAIKTMVNDAIDGPLFQKLRNESNEFNEFIASIYYKSLGKLKVAQFFGIDSYENIRDAISKNPGKTKGLIVQSHHLIEQRLIDVPGVEAWLGTDPKKWKAIALESVGAETEHQKITNLWAQTRYIPHTPKGGDKIQHYAQYTVEDVKKAAREIYADYPEIIEALGL